MRKKGLPPARRRQAAATRKKLPRRLTRRGAARGGRKKEYSPVHDVSGVHVLQGRRQLARIRLRGGLFEAAVRLAAYVGLEIAASRKLRYQAVDGSALLNVWCMTHFR